MNKWMEMFCQDEKNQMAEALANVHQRYFLQSPSLNWALGGGLWTGYTTCFYGPEGCLHGDTFIQYDVRKKDGERINHKGGSIKNLYERFNGIESDGRGVHRRSKDPDLEYWVSSINEEDRVIKNLVLDVVDSGVKPTFELTTKSGKKIIATADHKFYVGDGFLPLSELKVGGTVFIHNNTHYEKEKSTKERYEELCVKNHPAQRFKTVNEISYCRLRRSHAVVEAEMNGMTYDKYVDFLNTATREEVAALKTVPSGFHVHHLNEDRKDDRLENLIVVNALDHNREHALKDHNNLRFVVVEDQIESIVEHGEVQTYDIKCAFPYNNFIANGLVVHNSGKSLISHLGAAAAQKVDPEAISCIISTEHRPPNIKKLAALGVDPTRLMIRQVNTIHDVFDWISSRDSKFTNSDGKKGGPGLSYMLEQGAPINYLVIDSIKGLRGPKELGSKSAEDHIMGDLSFFLNPALRQILPVIRANNICTVFVQQVNMNMDQNEVKYQNLKYTVPSGQALKHFCETMALVERLNTKSHKLMNDDMKLIRETAMTAGHTIRVKIQKANLDFPFREAEFRINYNKGIVDTGLEIAKLAAGMNIITHPISGNTGKPIAAQWYMPDVFGEDKKWVGFENLVKELEESPELQRKVMAHVYSLDNPAQDELLDRQDFSDTDETEA